MSEVKRSAQLLRLAPFVVVAGLLCYAIVSLPPGEPRYAGKPLHYWLPRIRNQSLPASEQDKTRAAIACIGTNNLPLLLDWLREEEPPDSEPAYRKAINRLLSRQRLTNWRLEAKYRWSRPSMAYTVFTQYPQVAEVALPQFIAMLNDKTDLTKAKACMVLGNIGKPAIPGLLATLSHTNDIARALAAWALGTIGTNAIHVRPNLEAMLSDKSIFVRLDAAEAVGKMGGATETIVPVLLQCFHEGDRDTRWYALRVLSELKQRAISAVPDLTNSLAAVTNADDRFALLDTLKEIDRAAAARFDPPRPAAPSTAPLEESDTNLDEQTPVSKP